MTSAELEGGFGIIRINNMNDSRGVFLLVQTLQNQVVSLRPGIVYKVISPVARRTIRSLGSQNERIGFFANLTLKRFPIIGLEAVAILDLFLYI